MVLVLSYSSIVTSSLTVPRMKTSIDSLEDLANSQEVDVLLRSDVSTGEQILAINYSRSFLTHSRHNDGPVQTNRARHLVCTRFWETKLDAIPTNKYSKIP